jgi:hypothetical protein
MITRASRAFRPGLDFAEDRCLATVHPLVSQLGHHVHEAAAHQALRAPSITIEGLNGHRSPHQHGRGGHRPPVVMDGGGGGGSQGTLPSNYHDWGVITLWNTTNQRLTYSVSASTYQLGRYFNFTLGPGQYQSYFATYDAFNGAPNFHVSFDPIHQTNSIQLSHINTVFEKTSWYPGVGTEGFPYAIAVNVSGLYLTPI